jgi:predicted pyridoxine 5'-phosphate oxidase superfamily flavin-nucleotide-binding protein
MLAEFKSLIESNPISLATTNDGVPNIAVVAYAKVIGDNRLLVTDNFLETTVQNIKVNPQVAMAVFDADWNGLKITGTAEYLIDGEYFEQIKTMPENQDLPAKGAVLITVDKVRQIG